MSAPAQNNVDIDALLDLTEYEAVSNYHSPANSVSPAAASKATFTSPVPVAVNAPAVSTSQSMSGPSHNYDMYRQQTGFVPGAIANTMAVNQTNNTGYQDFGSLDYLSTFSPENEGFDFNTSPSQNAMDMDFESPAESQQFYTVNPSNIEESSLPSPPVLPTQTNNVGRLWPGAHSQAALAKAQAQQRQQQQIIQQQQQAQRQSVQPKGRGKAPQPADPIVEQKITQLLNSMRAKPSMPESQGQSPVANLPRSKKEEEEMDEDERLLASEEGKKLSSKERRQLRNKVSARAFRSRRKEYITQLEAEIANKVNENGDLRTQNRALMEENKRLSDLTRMLLSSPSFSNFLDHLSSNPATMNQAPQLKAEAQQQQQQAQQQPKDVNPYGSQQSQQQIGMAMIPEQSMDFSMLSIDNSSYNFQPQVFVVDTPDVPAPIDAAILSGKTSNFVELSFESDDEKVEMPVIERPVEKTEVSKSTEVAPVDAEFESDPEFALFHSEPATTSEESKELDTDCLSHIDLFGGIESEKALARFELVDATEEEASAAMAMARVQRISAHVDAVVSRLELLTMDLTLLRIRNPNPLSLNTTTPSVTYLMPDARAPNRWRKRNRHNLRTLAGVVQQQRARYSAASASFMADALRSEETRVNQAPAIYEYAPFEDSFSVRILTLEPGSGDVPLVGSLSVENLDLNPRYEAISYVWGTEGRCSGILCDGKPLPLTRSIDAALRRMRHTTLPRRLWADQICINQDDIVERSQQVSLMNAIYKGAEHIRVWLGQDEEGVAQDAIRMVHHLRDVFDDDEKHDAFKLAHSEELLQQDQELWVPLSKLTKLQWFNRIWIVQEIGTATSATLYWGDAEVDWDVLSHVAGILNQHYHYLRSRFSILTPNIRYLRRRFVEPDDDDEDEVNQNRSSFIYQLHRARHLRAKDPRDHVYAFLGHFSIHTGGKALAELKADYSRPIEDIFYEVAARELTDGESLLLLSACRALPSSGPREKAMPNPSLPSWVPDWRIVPMHLLASPITPHRASGDTEPQLWIDDTKRALKIRGMQIDKVVRLSWALFGKAFQFRRSNLRRLPIQILWQDICRHRRFTLKQPYLTGGSAFFAFMQTLTNASIMADLSRPYENIPPSEWLANGAAYLVRALGDSDLVAPDIRDLASRGDAFRWSHEATLVARYRKFAVTESGLFLIGPEMMEAGDVVVVLYGGRTPVVLRQRPDGEGWTLVGECYVHGIMNGEAMESEGLEEEEFTIL
ncbi:hypothetical protein G7Z17_g7387 [Cylindrodendrum hubeiense]|uniref:BZIP domain-containing protein n=1 Tax=Cylindrodendrum hubeiense TaxID=595255 RepID=A0A9P5L7E7_9HYPO|nr:hypothetical protein G7Z17_g7387 [Cylindrodendrum hubeiense]